jgi:hypothetical protein
MGKLLGGIQVAAGLMMLALSGLCGTFMLPDLSRNPSHLNDPFAMMLLGIVLLMFIGALASIRQGWRRITGSYVNKRSRTSRWIGAVIGLLIGLGWIGLQGMAMIGLAASGLDSGIRMVALSQILPGVAILLVGLFQIFGLIRTRDEI